MQITHIIQDCKDRRLHPRALLHLSSLFPTNTYAKGIPSELHPEAQLMPFEFDYEQDRLVTPSLDILARKNSA